MTAGNRNHFKRMAPEEEAGRAIRGLERQDVHGIVVLTTTSKLVVATIGDIGREGTAFYSQERLQDCTGVPVMVDVMLYEASTGRECFISDEPGWIVSSEFFARGVDRSPKYRYEFRFLGLRSSHLLLLARYLKENNGVLPAGH